MSKSDGYGTAPKNSHAFFMYGSSDDRLRLVVEYFRQGLAKNELCIFVTPEPADEAVRGFQHAGFDVSASVKDGALRIFQMDRTYLPEGHFAADYMLNNVVQFIEAASAQGYSGLRTAGEMSWLTEYPEFVEEAKAYEHSVNELKRRSPNFTGLCLYPKQDDFSKVLQVAAHTHPLFVSDSLFQLNPHYNHKV